MDARDINPKTIREMQERANLVKDMNLNAKDRLADLDIAKHMNLNAKDMLAELDLAKSLAANPAGDALKALSVPQMLKDMERAGALSFTEQVNAGVVAKQVADAAKMGAGLSSMQLAAGEWGDISRALAMSIKPVLEARNASQEIHRSLEGARLGLATIQNQQPDTAWLSVIKETTRQREALTELLSGPLDAITGVGALASGLSASVLRDFTSSVSKQLSMQDFRSAVESDYDIRSVFEGLATIDAYADEVENDLPDAVEPGQRHSLSSQQIVTIIVVFGYIIALTQIYFKVEEMGLDGSEWRDPENVIELVSYAWPTLIDLLRWTLIKENEDKRNNE